MALLATQLQDIFCSHHIPIGSQKLQVFELPLVELLYSRFQNAILQRHAEEVCGATSRLRAETAAAAERTAALLGHRRALVTALVQGLQSLALPGKCVLHLNKNQKQVFQTNTYQAEV